MNDGFYFMRIIILKISLLVFVISCGNNGPVEPIIPDPYDFSAVDQLLENSGLDAVVLLMKDGETVYEKSFGNYSSDERVTIASGTKLITAVLFARLIDDGVLELDDTIASWLPGWGSDDPRKSDITIRQCLSNTTGLPSDIDCLWEINTLSVECAYEIGDLTLFADPGTEFRYSGTGFMIAACAAEAASGKPYEALVTEFLTNPLGMDQTGFQFELGDMIVNVRPDAGAFSTAGDYATMCQMLLDGGVYKGQQFISSEMIDEIFRDQTNGVPLAYSPYKALTEYPELQDIRYGLGCWREEVDPVSGEIRVASCKGAFGFSPWIDFENDMVGILLVADELKDVMPVYVELRSVIEELV